MVSESGGDPYIEGFAGAAQAGLHAMAGRWEESRAHADAGRARLEDLGQKLVLGSSRMIVGTVAILAGRAQDAEQELRPGYEALEAMGETGYLSTIAGVLALALCAQGRLDEAESSAETSRQLGAEDDLTTQTFWRAAQAEVLASRGDFEGADRLIRKARDLLEGTDMVTNVVGVLISAAAVEKVAGDRSRARAALDEAIRLCESKEVDSALVHLRQLAADL